MTNIKNINTQNYTELCKIRTMKNFCADWYYSPVVESHDVVSQVTTCLRWREKRDANYMT